MATWTKFEEIAVWQKSRFLSKAFFEIVKKSENGFEKDYALKDQMNRSSGSIMDNIAEGFNRGGVKEFIQFLSYSKGSVGEFQSQLYRALERGYVSNEVFEQFYNDAEEISKMLKGLMDYLNKSGIKGFKFPTPNSKTPNS
jgi:four helix bundle protein